VRKKVTIQILETIWLWIPIKYWNWSAVYIHVRVFTVQLSAKAASSQDWNWNGIHFSGKKQFMLEREMAMDVRLVVTICMW